MNRLLIVRKYMTLSMKIKDEQKYFKAQKLHAKIVKKNDEKWSKITL
ncbi:MAG: hypothetical protein U9O87_02160 [Verrucomicrobiota bacterium]|nr:hypothetical protein [Verrucomicrobiota bacterium]